MCFIESYSSDFKTLFIKKVFLDSQIYKTKSLIFQSLKVYNNKSVAYYYKVFVCHLLT